MKRAISALLAVLIFISLAIPLVFAGGEKELKANYFQLNAGWGLLEPLERMISGPAYLALQDMERGEFQYGGSQTYQAAGAMGLYPARSPAPAFSRNLLVTKDFGVPIQTEPHIAVNPKNADHLVISAIEYALPYNSAYVSFDGGATWQGPRPIVLQRDTTHGGDPTVAFDRNGKVFSAFMGIGEEESYKIFDLLIDVPMSNISVAYSENGGLNWQEAVLAAESDFGFIPNEERIKETGRLEGVFGFSLLDKPWMSVGPDALDSENDAVYVSYTEFRQFFKVAYLGEVPVLDFVFLQTAIQMVKSENGGRTWSEPIPITPWVDGFLQDEAIEKLEWRVVQGSQPAVAPDGTVYVAWYDSTKDGDNGKAEIYVRTSKDGQEFGEPVLAAEFAEGSRRSRTAPFRNPSYLPQIAANKQGIFIVYGARAKSKPTDDGDIYFVRSLDGGGTFDKPQKINDDKTNQLQFFPAIAANSQDNLYVMWGDMREDPAGLKYHIYYTESSDLGENWGFDLPERAIHESATRVTDFPSNPNKAFPRGKFIGDYYAITASPEDVYLVWTDARLGEYGSMNQKIGFARRRAMPSPEIFISPPSGPSGQTVTIQAFNFQPEMNLFVRTAGMPDFAGRTNQDGRLTFLYKIPLSAGEDTYEVDVYDESANWATISFYVDFGFGDLKPAPQQVVPQQKEKDYSKYYLFIVIPIVGALIIVILVIARQLRKKHN